MRWRNRIIGVGEEAPDQLLANPRNFRIHPKAQQDAMEAVLDSVGFVQHVIVNQRTGFVVDGHLRVSIAISRDETRVPVVYVDLSDDEEQLILTTFDPIGAMAGTDREKLQELLGNVRADDERMQALLDGIRSRELQLGAGAEAEAGPAVLRISLAERFGVPPFSVLDARQGYWQDRKRAWLALGIQSELGRGGAGRRQQEQKARKASPGGSPRPAAKLGKNGKTQRGDGRGRKLQKGRAR